MKRHPSLQPLSRDHHQALVLARRLSRVEVTPGALADLAREVRAAFEADLEPHFRVEEELLLPALRERDGHDLAERTASDHARLRSLVAADWHADTPGKLGALLERHVRFEERVLFPWAESRLSEEALARVREGVLHGA